MYYVKKELEVSAAHTLGHLNYESKCRNLHGHNWKVTVYCKSETLNADGMVVDFARIKEAVMMLDHGNLNDFIDRPTAENIARWIAEQVGPMCFSVEIAESDGNTAAYDRGGDQ